MTHGRAICLAVTVVLLGLVYTRRYGRGRCPATALCSTCTRVAHCPDS